MQIGHSGRKGSTQLGWERMDHPLEIIHGGDIGYRYPCLECLVESESRGERPDRIENLGRRIGLKPEMSDLDLSLGREVCHLDEELLAPLVSVRKERSVDHDTQPPTALS